MRLGPWTIDTVRHVATRPGADDQRLTPLEARLLEHLGRHPSTAIPDEALLTEVWGYASGVASDAPYYTWRRLVRKLEPDPQQPRWLLRVNRGILLDLPASEGSFVGRRDELLALGEQCALHRLVTVIGDGGAGKTALLRAHLARTPGRFVDLTPCTDALDICARVAHPLGVALGADPAEQLGHVLASLGPTLLALDNAEQIAPAVGELVSGWLSAAPDLRIVATSRVALGAPDEHPWRLPPMSSPDAVELLTLRAEGRGPDAVLAEELVSRLGGLPLAIELCAARLRATSARDVLALLASRPLDLLRQPGAEGRHASVRAAIGWSWDPLPEPDRRALAEMSVFRGGFDLDAADRVLSGGGFALDTVERLVASSLLHAEPTDGRTRYGMSVVVRAFAEERLEELGLRDPTWIRHAAHYAALGAAWADRIGGPADERLARLLAEQDNLVVTAERVAVVGALAASCCLPIAALWAQHGPPTRAVALVERVFPTAPAELRARLHLQRSYAHRLAGNGAAALSAAHAALAEDASPAVELSALHNLCNLRPDGLDWQDVIARTDALEARIGPGAGAGLRGLVFDQLDRRDDARREYLAAAMGSRAEDDEASELAMLGALALVEYFDGAWTEARLHLEEALGRPRRWTEMSRCVNLVRLAHLLGVRGLYDEARATYEQALALPIRMGSPAMCTPILSRLADLHASEGRWSEAEETCGRALALARSCGSDLWHAHALAVMARVDRHAGRVAQARGRLSEAMVLGRADPGLVALAQARLAPILATLGDPEGATAQMAEAEAFAERARQAPLVVQVLAYGAEVHAHAGRSDEAKRRLDDLRGWVGRLELLPTSAVVQRIAELEHRYRLHRSNVQS